ncbi:MULTISPECIES: SRPBCC domain-containing protein [Methylobacterium]|uniref:Activator of Hsp90 ATPase homologue 1/2-like C-terminal domain-containing protein n=1 Tax=Methylobacterium jeotgali TaxID=381630 RepID=A0ABQ4T327_9HYPH|nr:MULTISPECIES: SRPBCC domain-containing protein [Methylobacterium]PIU07898.1 MAG: ATPase [Methylobacterium sp. CG09_land_8_20_14_0_10_71_15]PIU15618.1 MAG: ATPase [Methylobacterium sp. CG08_land_8_20_14_0_20_71_15]GBU18905.1 hypothetical protein AwMethylo_31200 [Methylobacterium sp.]GJE08286.1 hypothetical protein AOPFMNJM_3622 [Methylobacterium jeotgali]
MSETPKDTAGAPQFHMERHFAAPRQRVWDAFAKPEQLAQWFGPKGSTITILSHALRPGGMIHYAMDFPGGGRVYGRSVYREVEAPSRLVWVNSFADAQAEIVRAPFFDGTFPLELLTTVVLHEDGAGTRLELTWGPLDTGEAERRTFSENTESFRQGWTGSFDQLEAFLA